MPKRQKSKFDFKNPDYLAVAQDRIKRLEKFRAASPADQAALRSYYAGNIARFINDWGTTVDPRNVERGLPAKVPFLLFEKQYEFLEWMQARWRAQEPGLCEKSRDVGASWLLMAFAVSMCLFHRGITVGIGSRKESLVDNASDPSSLFSKARTFLDALPPEFRGACQSAHMRLFFPDTQSAITGEAGNNIGRGARTSIYFCDESAYFEQPELIEASLSATTNCRIDVSSVAGLANPFAIKRHSGRVSVFTFHWRSDPRKDDRWYAEKCRQLPPLVVSQEYDIDYYAGIEGSLIPSSWIQSAIGALEKLNIKPSGIRRGALDVADQGSDLNAFCGRHGQRVEFLRSWSGKNRDLFQSAQLAVEHCDALGYQTLLYDGDGLGAGIRGDIRVINETRKAQGRRWLTDEPYRGSAAPLPGEDVAGRQNSDFFANFKAQSWWALRARFQATHRAVAEGKPYNADDLISLDADLGELPQLITELSAPTYSLNTNGKVLVDKAPAGFRSPNLADSVCMAFCPLQSDGGFFAPIEAPGDAAPGVDINIPWRPAVVFAVCAAGVYPDNHDACAVAYFACTPQHDRNPPLVLLDWDLQKIGAGLMQTWLADVVRRKAELTKLCEFAHEGALVIEDGGLGSTIHKHATTRGYDVLLTDESLTEHPLTDCAVAVSQYVRSGACVFSKAAREKIVNYKGTARNHLLAQTSQFGTRGQDQAGAELLAAFVDGVLLAFADPRMQARADGVPLDGATPNLDAALAMVGP